LPARSRVSLPVSSDFMYEPGEMWKYRIVSNRFYELYHRHKDEKRKGCRIEMKSVLGGY